MSDRWYLTTIKNDWRDWFKMAKQRDLCLSLPKRAPKLQLAVEKLQIGGSWNPQNRYPNSKDK